MIKSILLTAAMMTSSGLFSQKLKNITYHDGKQKLNGLITTNTAKQLPGVLILPAWKGIDEEAKRAAADLEKQGYIAFIADIYGEGNVPTDNSLAAKTAGYYKQNYEAYQRRISLALNELKKTVLIQQKSQLLDIALEEQARWKQPGENCPWLV